MPTLSIPDISTLRDDHPHLERFYLSVLRPQTLYTSQVTGSPARGARAITVSDVSGNIANIIAGQTAIVYNSITGDQISKRRLRAVAGHVLTFDENNVNWSTNFYIKILENWELWSVFPYIDPATVIFYKDRDIAYTDENDKLKPVAIIDSIRAKFLDSATVSFSITAIRSYAMAVGATIASYAWSCIGGTIANAAIASTTVTFSIAGQYWLRLVVTDSNGKTQSIRIPLYVHTRTGANAPYSAFSTEDITASWNDGGASCNVMITGNCAQADFPDETQVLIWSEQYYAGTEDYLGENGNTIILGYIQPESVKRDFTTGSVRMRILSICDLLKIRKMTSVSLEESIDTATWYRFPSNTLTVARCVHHLWRWHSTLFEIANVFVPVADTTTLAACDDFENGSLYSMVQQFTYDNGIFANVCSTFLGDIHVEVDINILPDAARNAIDTIMAITGKDRVLDTDIDFVVRTTNTSSVYLSGIGKDADGKYVPIISACPGEIPDTFGEQDAAIERQVLNNQADANVKAGRLFAKLNTELAELRIQLAGNYPADLVPQEWWTVADNTNKRIDIDNLKFVARNVSLAIDVLAGTRKVMLTLEPEAISVLGDGITVVPPVPPDPTEPNPPDWPPLDFPPFPPIPYPPPIPVPTLPGVCIDDSPNGPFDLHGYTELLSYGYNSNDMYYPCTLRAASSANPSSITIDGLFLRLVDGDWVNNPDNDWYHVYALDGGGTIVAEATMTGSGSIRTGSFAPPAPVSITRIRIVVDSSTYSPGELVIYTAHGLGDYSGIGGGVDPGINHVSTGGFYDAYFGKESCYGSRPVLNPFNASDACDLTKYCILPTYQGGVQLYTVKFGFELVQFTSGNPNQIFGVFPQITYDQSGAGGYTFYDAGDIHVNDIGIHEYTYAGNIGANLDDNRIGGLGIHFSVGSDPGDVLIIKDAYFKVYVSADCAKDATAMTVHSAYLYNVCK